MEQLLAHIQQLEEQELKDLARLIKIERRKQTCPPSFFLAEVYSQQEILADISGLHDTIFSRVSLNEDLKKHGVILQLLKSLQTGFNKQLTLLGDRATVSYDDLCTVYDPYDALQILLKLVTQEFKELRDIKRDPYTAIYDAVNRYTEALVEMGPNVHNEHFRSMFRSLFRGETRRSGLIGFCEILKNDKTHIRKNTIAWFEQKYLGTLIDALKHSSQLYAYCNIPKKDFYDFPTVLAEQGIAPQFATKVITCFDRISRQIENLFGLQIYIPRLFVDVFDSNIHEKSRVAPRIEKFFPGINRFKSDTYLSKGLIYDVNCLGISTAEGVVFKSAVVEF